MSWGSWVALEHEYRESARNIKEARKNLEVNTTRDAVDKELMGGMISDGREVSKILKDKVYYEFNSLSDEELSLLTDRQREIAELRQQGYSYTEISAMLGISPKTVFDVFKKAVRNVKKAKKQQCRGVPVGLSPQQEKIFKLFWLEHKTKKEIAKIMGTSPNSIKTQIRRIRQRGGDKIARKLTTGEVCLK